MKFSITVFPIGKCLLRNNLKSFSNIPHSKEASLLALKETYSLSLDDM
jgi:hypothetical protein